MTSHYDIVDRLLLTHVPLLVPVEQAMTTKGVMKEAKSGVVAWLRKVIDLHESLPDLCADHAPELLGEPKSSVTCASSAFLMSFSSLLLRLGSLRFSSIDTEVGATVINIGRRREVGSLWGGEGIRDISVGEAVQPLLFCCRFRFPP